MTEQDNSILEWLEDCPLHRRTVFGMRNVSETQLSIARFYGGCRYNGEEYIYHRPTDELIRADVLKWKQGKDKPKRKSRAVYRPMTDEEKARALALGKCKFPPASFSKRFAREISAQARERGEITDRQANRLLVQAYIYRRQMPPALVPETPPEEYETPKQRAARGLAALKLDEMKAAQSAAPPFLCPTEQSLNFGSMT